MSKGALKYFDHGKLDLTTAATTYKITILKGGESITLKSASANTGLIYIGHDNIVSSSTGFELDASETLTLMLPATFGRENYIEIWATGSVSGDDIFHIKLTDLDPETQAST